MLWPLSVVLVANTNGRLAIPALAGLLVELEPMYATSERQTYRQTDGQTDDGRRSLLNAPAPPPTGRGHNNIVTLKSGLEVTQDH